MTTIKKCRSCGAEKAINDFYADKTARDRHRGECKECTKKQTDANRRKKIVQHREYMRSYRKGPVYKKAREKSGREYAERHPERRRAKMFLNNAKRRGTIKAPKACEKCGAQERLHGHHDDYTKPLSVKWLCRKCHQNLHGTGEKA